MNLTFEILTPLTTVFKDEVDEIVVPTVNGEITILPNHINLLTQVFPGELIVKKGSNIHSLAVTGGFMEVSKNRVSILADYAIKTQDIEIAKVEEAKKRAEKIMQEKTSEKDFKIAQGELLKAIIELKVAGKRRRRS
ncbi:MAG: ATP synthase F1 subunit epsilon [Candidatus Levybacteria bacterium]|nr:ATP synthase F1 subunit epsilon [Candidatus Levybacteria bacterium]